MTIVQFVTEITEKKIVKIVISSHTYQHKTVWQNPSLRRIYKLCGRHFSTTNIIQQAAHKTLKVPIHYWALLDDRQTLAI